jgi:hypothetical protein
MEGAKLAQENAELREERNAFRDQLRVRDAMVFEHNVFWQGDGDSRVGPFCPKCWDGETRAARMEDRSNDHGWRCRVCDTATQKPGRDSESGFGGSIPITRC